MPAALIVVRLALRAEPVVHWLWRNREPFEPVLRAAGDFATAAVTNPDGAVRRVGNTLVFGRPDGGPTVLAFVEQAAPRLDHIEEVVADVQAGQAAVLSSLGALQAAQAALSSSLGAVQTLSMVSLGFAALLPVVLGTQFRALGNRLDALSRAVRGLDKKFDADKIACLRTGIDLIEQGMRADDRGRPPEARAHYLTGLRDCLHSVNYFQTLLDGLLSEGSPDRDEVRVLARHLSVAVLGAAACHVGLDSDGEAVGSVERQLPLLRRAARRVFAATVGRDPARFLSLPVGGGEVSLAFMADLFQQARLAGVADAPRDVTPAGWFEEHRATISPFARRLPYTRRAGYLAGLRKDLLDAVTAVEEVNRVRGVQQMVGAVAAAGESNRGVMRRVLEAAARVGGEGDHLVWGLAPGPT